MELEGTLMLERPPRRRWVSIVAIVIPVVVLTAHAEEESRRRANEGGADAFVTKPFQPNDFRTTVLSLLE